MNLQAGKRTNLVSDRRHWPFMLIECSYILSKATKETFNPRKLVKC